MSAEMKAAALLDAQPILFNNAYTTSGPADAGTALDIRDYDGVGAVIVRLKNTAGTAPTFDGSLVECDTSDGTFTAKDPAVTFTQSTGATSSATYVTQIWPFSVTMSKRYLKVNLTIGATSGTGTYAVDVTFLGFKKSF